MAKKNLQDVSEVIRHKKPVESKCRRCKGTRKINGKTCPECGGAGTAKYIDD